MAGSVTRQLTASALVMLSDRRLVLLFHAKLGVHLYPGGHVEPHETPDEAIIREVAEETGLSVVLLGPSYPELEDRAAGVFSLVTPYLVMCERIGDPKQVPHDHIDLIYPCIVEDEEGADFGGLVLVRQNDIGSLPTFPSFRELLYAIFADETLWQTAEMKRASLRRHPETAGELR
jgi:8-oxo-dGTP pyrophosphatase MutT (NUDIX family)